MKTIGFLSKRIKDDAFSKIDEFNFLEASSSQKEEFKEWAKENISPLLIALTKQIPDIVPTDEGIAIVLNLPKEEIFKNLESDETLSEDKEEIKEVLDSLESKKLLKFKSKVSPAKRFIADSLNTIFTSRKLLAIAKVKDDDVVVESAEENIQEEVPQIEGLASIENVDTTEFVTTVVVPAIEEKLRLLGFDSNYSVSYSNGIISIEINETINETEEVMDSISNMSNLDVSYATATGLYALQNGRWKAQLAQGDEGNKYFRLDLIARWVPKDQGNKFSVFFKGKPDDLTFEGTEGEELILNVAFLDSPDFESMKTVDDVKAFAREWYNAVKSIQTNDIYTYYKENVK
nr:MAG TPA: hypothetical protein [Caudoviricetes sp.]